MAMVGHIKRGDQQSQFDGFGIGPSDIITGGIILWRTAVLWAELLWPQMRPQRDAVFTGVPSVSRCPASTGKLTAASEQP